MRPSNRSSVSLLRRGRKDPVWFFRELLGQEPEDYQCDWAESVRDNVYTSIRTCHGPGKSRFAGGMLVPWFLLCHPNSIVVTTAPTYRQVGKIIWKEIRDAKASAPVPLGGRIIKTEWILDKQEDGTTNWFAMGFTSKDTDANRFVGIHSKSGHILVIVDEAAGVSEEIYDSGISSIMSGAGSKLLLIGNPVSVKGEFRRSQRKDSEYNRFKVSAFQTPNFVEFGLTLKDFKTGAWKAKTKGKKPPKPHLTSWQYVDNRLRKWGPDHPQFRARILAEFPVSGEHNLIPLWAIEAAKERNLPRVGDQRWGADVGGEGDDPSIVGCMWETGHYRKIAQEAKTKLSEFGLRVAITARMADEQPIAINIDNVGLGLGAYQTLRDEVIWDERRGRRVPICKADGGAAAKDKVAFLNARAEMWWELKIAFEEGRADIDPLDEDLAEELLEIRWKPTQAGKIQIESKRDFRARTGKSPDNADTMVYAHARLSALDFVTMTV